MLSILTIDGSDNLDYFLYKYNLSKKDQKRIKDIDRFYKDEITIKSFSEKNLNKIFYFKGRQTVIDILSFKLFISKKIEKKFLILIEHYRSKVIPTMPILAKDLMEKYEIPEGKSLGNKLKDIEKEWVNNDFKLTEKQISKIIGL